MIALLKHDFKNLIKGSGNIAVFFFFPTLITLLMGFLFSNSYTSSLLSSYDFYGVTMIFFIAMMGATVPANLFLEKNIKNANTRIFYSPVSRVAVYLSKILTCFLFIGFALTLNLIIFHSISLVNFGGSNIIYVILLLLNFILFLCSLSAAITVTVKSEIITNIIISNSVSFLAIFSGIFLPVASLGAFIDTISNVSPIKWVMTTVFELIYDGSSPNYGIIMIGLLILSFLLLLIVHKKYKPEDYV